MPRGYQGYTPNPNDNWLLFMVLLLGAFLIAAYLIVIIAQILLPIILLLAFCSLVYALLDSNEDALKLSFLFFIATIILFVIIAVVMASPIWKPATDLVQYLNDANVLQVTLPKTS